VYREFIGKRDDPQEAPFQFRDFSPKTDIDLALVARLELAIERPGCTSPPLNMAASASPDFRSTA
jgi:hypothetical protein